MNGISTANNIRAVTTVWRAKLGTKLLLGFCHTTAESAYFRYLCYSEFASAASIAPSSLSVWTHAGVGSGSFQSRLSNAPLAAPRDC